MRIQRRPSLLILRAAIASLAFAALILALVPTPALRAQTMPSTEGETLIGKKLVIPQVLSGHNSIFIMGFSKSAGDPCTDWMRALHKDPAFSSATVYEAAMLAAAPSFVRGMIKSSMRKGLSPAEQENFLILISDEKPWQDFFHMTSDKDPYVILLDAKGKTLWQGHGPVQSQLSQIKSALP